MNAAACQDFCCSTFANYVDEELTGRDPDLTNAILPIFRRTNFTGADGRILTRDDYDILRPSLQLACMFLQSDPMVLFLIKLFDGDLKTGNGITIPRSELNIDHPDGNPFQAWEVHTTLPRGEGEMTDHDRRRAAQILTRMPDMIRFELREDAEEPAGKEGTSTVVDAPLPANLRQFFPWGQRSVVWMNDPIYKIRHAMANAAKPSARIHIDGCTPTKRYLSREYLAKYRSCNACSWPLELVAARFCMTKTLIHELAHSFRFAAWGSRLTYEIPQTHIAVGETGCEVWMALIGGTPRIASDYGDVLQLESIPGVCNEGKSQPKWGGPTGFFEMWPNHAFLKMYEEHYEEDLRPLRLDSQLKDDLYTRIPLIYFEKLFTQAFWDRVAVEGPEAMKPSVVGKWYFKWKGTKEAWIACNREGNLHNVSLCERLVEYERGTTAPILPICSRLKRKRRSSDDSDQPSSLFGRWCPCPLMQIHRDVSCSVC